MAMFEASVPEEFSLNDENDEVDEHSWTLVINLGSL